MHRPRSRVARHASHLTLVLAGAAACRAFVACGGDDEPPRAGPEGPSEGGPGGRTGGEPDGAPVEGDGAPREAGAPSFCRGIVLAASLDGNLVPERGEATPVLLGSPEAGAPARFGQGVALFADEPDAGASVYFVGSDAGPPVVPTAEGSISLWVRGLPPAGPARSPVFFRLVGDLPPAPLVSSGLVLARVGSRFGLLHTPPNAQREILVFPVEELAPFVRPDGFNHFVASWQRRDAGSDDTARLAVNGGLGEIFQGDAAAPVPDASTVRPDAGSGADAAPPPPSLPYARTNALWNDAVRPLALRLGGPTGSALESVVDDVVVWDRMLERSEVEALYRAGASVADVCRLR